VPINNSEMYGINRGFELMLRKAGGEKKETKLASKGFNFEKVFSLLKREIFIKIEFNIMKKK
jgi:hypothetical protein